MKLKRKILLFLIFSGVMITSLTGQNYHTKSNRALDAYLKGKKAYDFVDYQVAEKKLKEAMDKDEGFLEAYLLLAELYKDQKKYEDSEAAYEKVMTLDSLFFIPAVFSLAEVEFFLGKYNESKAHFNSFMNLYKKESGLRKRAKKYLSDCEWATTALASPVKFKPISLGDSINTADDEYWPAITVDDKMLMFTRQVKYTSGGLNSVRAQEDFYVSTRKDSLWSQAVSIGKPLNTQYNEGAQTLSAGGQYMYFTACDRRDSQGGCDIYYSTRTANGWSQGINIGSPVNTGGWDTQPSVSADGRELYFVSNRPGGIGGMDIWVSRLDSNGRWMEPENLGPSVNTPGDEMSPFIHFDGQTLYFSSNGRPCMGGFDLYVVRKTEGGWGEPENLGWPINTQSDETGMIINASGEIAYFASEKGAGRGRDLYYFELPVEYRPIPVSYLRGTVYDKSTGQRLMASYELLNLATGKTVMKSFTGKNGEFLVCLNTDQNYGINVMKENYLFFSESFLLDEEYTSSDPFIKRIPLSPLKVGEKMSLYNVFFDTDSWELRDESLIELGNLLKLLQKNQNISVEIGGHTDSSGSVEHNLVLSSNRAESVRRFLIDSGIDSTRLIAKGYGESIPVADNLTAEGRRLNRRTEITILEDNRKRP